MIVCSNIEEGDAEIILSAIAIDPKWTNEFAFSQPYTKAAT